MAVRKSERRRLRRQLISRTARVWSRLNRKLNKDLNEIAQAWLRKLIKQAENEIASGDISNVPDFPEKFTKILQQTLREALAYGYWLQQLYLYERRGKKYKGKITLADGDDVKELLQDFIVSGEWNDVIPEDAANWISGYVPKLAGVLSQDVLEKTRDVIRNSLLGGSTLQERIKELRKAAPELASMTQHRLEAIARTEITRADTLGRLTSMKANDDVIGVEFSAIMDDRTTDICASRHGLVMRLDDPRLPENTPPLHVNCRSLLNAVTIYDYPDGLLTSHEFDEIPAGIQRPEDIEEVKKIFEAKVDEISLITEKLQELQAKIAYYEDENSKLGNMSYKARQANDYNTHVKLTKQRDEISSLISDVRHSIRDLKIEAADKGIIFASGLEKTLDKTEVDMIIEVVQKAPADIRKIWNLYEDKMKIADYQIPDINGSYFRSFNESIYFNLYQDKNLSFLPSYSVLFHELGHLIDYAIKDGISYYSQNGRYNLYDTLKSEINNYINTTCERLKKQAISHSKNSKDVKIEDAYEEIKKEFSNLPLRYCRGIADVFGGITLNKINYLSHDTEYWKAYPESVCLEFFAETYSSSIVNPEAIEVVKKYIPKSYNIFNEILKDIVKGDVK